MTVYVDIIEPGRALVQAGLHSGRVFREGGRLLAEDHDSEEIVATGRSYAAVGRAFARHFGLTEVRVVVDRERAGWH